VLHLWIHHHPSPLNNCLTKGAFVISEEAIASFFPSGVVESLIKRKDLPEWEANIEGSNVKDNELL